ncbi:MAG: SixA phosphatase family protein [Thermoleophilaceae bacterium]
MIWFLRHGEAEDGEPDSERRLTEKGERQARDAGAALAALGVEFDLCLTSPKVRARDTALLAAEALSADVRVEQRLAGGPFDAVELAAGFDEILLVGHEPDFSNTIADLTGAQIDLKKGGIAAVERNELRVLLRAKDTKLIASVKQR